MAGLAAYDQVFQICLVWRYLTQGSQVSIEAAVTAVTAAHLA